MKNGQSTHRLPPIWLILCLCLLLVAGCQKPPIKISLISDRVSYEPKEPIRMQIRVYNDKTNIFGWKKPVIARRGFFNQDFHLLLNIIDPNGVPVAKIRPESLIEPAPPNRLGNRFIVPVEVIPPDGENVWVMNDVRQYYRLENTGGWYTADVRASLETFSRYKEGPTGELYGELFARCNKAYNPLSSNKIRFEIVPAETKLQAALKVHVGLLTFTGGAQQKSEVLENADVRVFRVSEIPQKYKPISRKMYGSIWNDARPLQSRLTHSNGIATFSGIEPDDYLILARHPALGSAISTGEILAKDDARWQAGKVVEAYLSIKR